MSDFNKNDLIGRIIRRLFWHFCKLFPVKKDKVVVMSYYGRGYCDNPKYVVDEILRQNLGYDIYWAVKDMKINNNLPEGVKPILIDSFKYIYHMTTAKLWIDNSRKTFYDKRDNQLYIQTWHGGHGLKNIEGACKTQLDAGYINIAKKDSKMSNLFLSNSGLLTDVYKNAFWYDGPILEEGLPRNDMFFDKDFDTAAVRRALNLPEDKKVILYAPTFRTDHSLEPYKLDCKKCAEAFKERFGGEWVVLVRLHPVIFEKASELNYDEDYSVNASEYFDIQDLYTIADAVITDYSSVVLDYMVTKKPSFIFATDIADYSDDRGFLIPLEDLPSPIATSNDELRAKVLAFDYEVFTKDAESFMDKTRVHETGHASKSAVEWIKKNM